MITILAKKENNKIDSEIEIISKIKEEIKKDPITKELLRQYSKDESFIDAIPLDFSEDIDVSAKTINARILLNKNLLKEPFDIILRYAIHELVHSLQHVNLNDDFNKYEEYEYLDRPDELEAFQVQIEFDKERRGEDAVVEYVEDLLDYHDIPENEYNDKRNELMKNI